MPSWKSAIYRLARLDLKVKTVGGSALAGWKSGAQRYESASTAGALWHPMMPALPSLTILAAALAAIPAVIRAVRIDPVEMLRAE